MSKQRPNILHVEQNDEQSIRCLNIVDNICMYGPSSVSELIHALQRILAEKSINEDIIKGDIDYLQHHGIPIKLEDDKLYHLRMKTSGFKLRITTLEALTLKAWGYTCIQIAIPKKNQTYSEEMFRIITILENGIRIHFANIQADSTLEFTQEEFETLKTKRLGQKTQSVNFTSIARTIYRRLSIIDLFENHAAIDIDRISRKLDISVRTLRNDLDILRRAGINIRYCRSRQKYIVEDLNWYLCDHLSCSQVKILLELLQPLLESYLDNSHPTLLQCASYKLSTYLQQHHKQFKEVPEKPII